MDLDTYLRTPGSMSVPELRMAIGVRSDQQIRQWQHKYADRLPSPANCVALEQATKGALRRQDLRPDWMLIWPELIEAEAAA